MYTRRSHSALAILAVIMAINICAGNIASAATVTYGLTLTEDSGSVNPGASYYGTFSFDDSHLSAAFIPFSDFISFDLTVADDSYSLAEVTNSSNDGIRVNAGEVTYFGDIGPGTAANFNSVSVQQLNFTDHPNMAWTQFQSGDDRGGAYNISSVPVPAAVWLFGSGLIGLIGFTRKMK